MTEAKQRKSAWIAVILLLALAVAACSPASTEGSTTTADEGPTTTADGGQTSSTGATNGGTTTTPTPAFVPEGTVTFFVPAPPGGGSDVLVRSLAEFFRGLGVADVVVENFEGVESYEVMLADHQGDTNVLNSATASSSYIRPIDLNLTWSWEDFTQLAIIGEDSLFLVVNANGEFGSFEDLVAAAGERTLTVGQAGQGGVNDVARVQLEETTGLEFEPVVFETGAEQVVALLANDIDFAIMEPGEFIAQQDAGELQGVLTLNETAHPNPSLANIPVPGDVGLDVDFVNQFRSFIGSPGIGDDARAYWIDILSQWQASPAFADYVEASLVTPAFISGADAEAYIAEAEAAFVESRES